MPYDYYDYFKKQQQNKIFTDVTEIVRQNIWSETINFRQSQQWIAMEDKLFNELYNNLRYS